MNMEEARLYCLKLERDRERSWRESRQGAFEASMLSLDEHVAKFDDPGKIATFSDGGKDAEAVRSCGEDLRSGVVDPAVKKRMLNRLRKHPHLQKALRRLIANATGGKRKPVKKTHIEKIFEILFGVWWGPRDVGNDTFGIRCGPMTMIHGDADDSRHRFLAIGLRYDLRQMPGVMPNSRRNTLAR